MTFLEAAIELLRQSGEPLTVAELTQRALAGGLLTNPGRSPELSMQARLSTELRKGEGTLLLADGERFGLKRYDKPRRDRESLAPPAGQAVDVDDAEVSEASEDVEASESETALPGKRRRRRRGGRGRNKAAATTAAADPGFPEAGTPEEAIMAEQLAAEAEAEAEDEPPAAVAIPSSDADDDDEDDGQTIPIDLSQAEVEDSRPTMAHFTPRGEDEPGVDLDAILAPVRRPRGLAEVPDEAALAAEYQDELAPVGAVPVAGEHVDEQTADEDRPLLPAIHGDDGRDRRRRHHGRERDRGRERGRPEQQDRPEFHQRGQGEQKDVAPAAPEATGEPRAAAAQGPAQAAGSLADIGVQLLKAIGDGRPAHVRQLAAMALKRRMIGGEADDVARTLKIALSGDGASRQLAGLRPRVRSHGGGSFSLAARGLEQEITGHEEGLAQRAADLARATRTALRRRLGRLPLPAFEQLAVLFLERSGYVSLERVKRVDQTSYLMGRGPGGGPLLIGVRAGEGEAGRRAVGELRAGVLAKQMSHGLLLSASRLGDEGLRELGQAVPPVTALDGDALAEAMIAEGVGVIRASLPVSYLDPDALADLGD